MINEIIQTTSSVEQEAIAEAIEFGYVQMARDVDSNNGNILESCFVIGSDYYNYEWFDIFGELVCVLQEIEAMEAFGRSFPDLHDDEQIAVTEAVYGLMLGTNNFDNSADDMITVHLESKNYFLIVNETDYEYDGEYYHLTIYNSPLQDVW